jgi:arylsulfatase A-like enzyme/Tfp pilus assembly protein PilF
VKHGLRKEFPIEPARARSRWRLLALALSGCSPAKDAQDAVAAALPRRAPLAGSSVLLITLDTTRRDVLGFADATPAAGDVEAGPARTKTLDALAAEGVEFTSAWAVAPLTRPAHASLFTGRSPEMTGVRDNSVHSLDEAALTLAEEFSRAGHVTAAVAAAPVVGVASGLEQGFSRFVAPPPDGRTAEWAARDVTDAALHELSLVARGGSPYFLWTHYFDPHAPHAKARSSTETWSKAPLVSDADPRADWPAYRAEVERVDRQLARLLAAARAAAGARPLLVVVTADHGEALGEGGEATHGHALHAATLHVPLLFHHPALRPGRCAQVASQVDLAPTLRAAFGFPESHASSDGISLLSWLMDERPRHDLVARIVRFESRLPWHEFGWPWLDGATDGEWLFTDRPVEAWVALTPAGAPDAASRERDEASASRRAALRAAALAASGPFRDGDAREAAPEPPPGLARSPLLALGYAAARSTPPVAKSSLIEPHERMALVRLRDRGLELLLRGDFAAAESTFRELLERNPDPAPATLLLAVTASRIAEALPDGEARDAALGRAAAAWRAAVGAAPDAADRHLNLGLTLLELRDREAARIALDRAAELAPDDPVIAAARKQSRSDP